MIVHGEVMLYREALPEQEGAESAPQGAGQDGENKG